MISTQVLLKSKDNAGLPRLEAYLLSTVRKYTTPPISIVFSTDVHKL